jgi:hypothetical protein
MFPEKQRRAKANCAMSRGVQAKIIAVMFATGALSLIGAIADDWWSKRVAPAGNTPASFDTRSSTIQPARPTQPVP